MKISLDAHFSLALDDWIEQTFHVDAAFAVQSEATLAVAKDPVIFREAKHAGAVVMPEDRGFVDLVEISGLD